MVLAPRLDRLILDGLRESDDGLVAAKGSFEGERYPGLDGLRGATIDEIQLASLAPLLAGNIGLTIA